MKTLNFYFLVVSSFLMLSGRLHTEDIIKLDKNKEHNECSKTLEADENQIHLGVIFAGQTLTDLPGPKGISATMEFKIKGKDEGEYFISSTLNTICNLKSGYVEIQDWNWEILDKSTNGTYRTSFTKQQLENYKLNLIKQSGHNECDDYAKVQLNINKLFASPDASPGEVTFLIVVSLFISEF